MGERTAQRAEGQAYESIRSFSYFGSGMMRNSQYSYSLSRNGGKVLYSSDLPDGFDKRRIVEYDPGEAEFDAFVRLAQEGGLIEALQEQSPEDEIRMTDSSSSFSISFSGSVPGLNAYRPVPAVGVLLERLKGLTEGHEPFIRSWNLPMPGLSMSSLQQADEGNRPAQEPKSWVFCPECGTKNTGRFCRECGTKLLWPCPKCGAKGDGKFCAACGAKLR